MDILDAYTRGGPDPQAVLDIFKGEWSSRMPADLGAVSTPGQAALFEDARIDWLAERIGGFAGRSVLELGPLEAGHTTMMARGGAARIVAVEGNSRAYLKCLCIKELLGLSTCSFVHADIEAYLETCEEDFDLSVLSGVLYHMTDPCRMLELAIRRSRRLYIWTHYFDAGRVAALGAGARQFGRPTTLVHRGRSYQASRRSYGQALGWRGFCGGRSEHAYWLTRESLHRLVEDLGCRVVATAHDDPAHPNGPALSLYCERDA